MVFLGPILGLILLIFISNMDSGIECEFADDTELCGAVDTLERRDVIQMDLDMLETWAHANLMELNKGECKALHQGCGNPRHTNGLDEKVIESSPVEEKLLEKGQRRAMELVTGLEHLLCEDRLVKLGPLSLEKRRWHGDLLATFQQLKRTCWGAGEGFFASNTRLDKAFINLI